MKNNVLKQNQCFIRGGDVTFAILQKFVKLAETRKSTDHQSRISPDVLSRLYRPKVDGLNLTEVVKAGRRTPEHKGHFLQRDGGTKHRFSVEHTDDQ